MIIRMTRVLMILGSGETSPAMVTPHQHVFAGLAAGTRGGRARFAVRLPGERRRTDRAHDPVLPGAASGFEAEAVSFRSAPVTDPVSHAIEMARLRTAGWIFAGPGSPSYALRTWAGSAVPEALHGVLRDGGAVVFASAAALTLGLVTVPVYEIYKVGETPRWLDGLDVLGRATGLRAAIVPHWNNAEGGTHDTRFCYLGERRLRMLEDLLPEDTFVLGIDEHTGIVIDLDSGSADIVGRGSVTVRARDREWSLVAGSTTTLKEIADHAQVETQPTALPNGPTASPQIAALEQALEQRDVRTALALAVELDRAASTDMQRQTAGSYLARCIAALGSLVDRNAAVAPYIELLLAERNARPRREALEPTRMRFVTDLARSASRSGTARPARPGRSSDDCAPIALVGSGEYLPVMTEIEGALIAGRAPRYVQLATAAAPEGQQSLDRWQRLGKQQADRLGVEQVVVDVRTRADADNPAFAAAIGGAGLIYLSGGNPAYLAETLRDTAVWHAIVAAHQVGAAVAGCSAGAMALSDWAPSIRDLNQRPAERARPRTARSGDPALRHDAIAGARCPAQRAAAPTRRQRRCSVSTKTQRSSADHMNGKSKVGSRCGCSATMRATSTPRAPV